MLLDESIDIAKIIDRWMEIRYEEYFSLNRFSKVHIHTNGNKQKKYWNFIVGDNFSSILNLSKIISYTLLITNNIKIV